MSEKASESVTPALINASAAYSSAELIRSSDGGGSHLRSANGGLVAAAKTDAYAPARGSMHA